MHGRGTQEGRLGGDSHRHVGGGGWHQPRSPREDSDLGRKGPLSSVLQDKQPRLATAVPPACSVTP